MNDPTDDQVIPIGKQTLRPSHIFYRSCSGIWQQVWLEAVPRDYITELDVSADADGKGEGPFQMVLAWRKPLTLFQYL